MRIEQHVDSTSYHILITFYVSGTVLSMCIISLNERDRIEIEIERGGEGEREER